MSQSPHSSSSLPKKLSKIHFELYPKQRMAFDSRATEKLFGGASEGGKSHYGRVETSILSATVANLQTRIFRKHYNDVISNHMDGPTSYPEMLRPWIRDKFVNVTENEVQFDNGSVIRLAGMLHKKDLEKHQGLEKHYLWIDESTQIPEAFIKGLRGWVRMPEAMKALLPQQLRPLFPTLSDAELRELLPRVLLTANPIGVSVGYHRRGFVEGHKPGELHVAPDKDGGFLRVYIPSRIEDNPSADPEAQRKRLLAAFGEDTSAAMIKGVWDAPTGDFFKEYDDDVHSVPDFTPPSHWFKFRTFDWGSADPFVCYWWCVSDGEEFTDDKGRRRFFPRGALIAYREWYGCKEDEPDKGIDLANELIARGIVDRTKESMCGLTFSDNLPFQNRGQKRNGEKYTMADEFMDNGCPLTLGNTARVYGWKQLRTRLTGLSGVPMIYLVESCLYGRSYLPALGYSEKDTEDAQESGEATHACDAIRLACTLRPLVQDKKEEVAPKFPSANISITAAQALKQRKKTGRGRF